MSASTAPHEVPRTTTDATDAELVARVRDGERDAFGELVQRHQQLIHRHAAGMGIDQDSCEDLVQDAFVRAWSRLDECRDPAHFRAWLFRIARNMCLDHLKNVRRATVRIGAVSDAELVDGAASNPDIGHALRQALDALPTSQREAFLLKHDAGYTYDEIADLTDSSPSAVKMRVHRAREALRDCLV